MICPALANCVLSFLLLSDRVAALEPDLVLASLTVPGHEAVVASLEARGLQVVALAPRSLENVYDDIHTIAGHLGVSERGDALVSEMRTAIPAPDTDCGQRPGILVEWWPKPVIVPGRQSWVTDLIAVAGGENPWATADVESRVVEPADVERANPDAVVISWCGVDPRNYRDAEVYRRSWKKVAAIEARQVHAIPEAFLGRPGPRLVEGLVALKEVVACVRRGAASSNRDWT